jgi:hypothetical protein
VILSEYTMIQSIAAYRMPLGFGTRLDTSQRGAALREELVDSTPLSAQCEKPHLLLVAGVWLALRRARVGSVGLES